ncbi:MAG: histidine triad nucleotide-binding protein [Gammaproteobacteria bacterium]|jgi:histidine triad (HIT) family protein
MTDCLFCKIVAGEIPADKVYEDDHVIAFRDIAPKAPTHVLVIPRRHISTLNELTPEDAELVGRMYLAARDVAHRERIAEPGYRTVVNCNADGGQAVYHIHLHLLGGRSLKWPPG